MPPPVRRGAVFLDKDGTVLVDVPYNVDPARMRLAPGAAAALRYLGMLGLPLIVVSNQPGVALRRFDAAALVAVERRLREMFAAQGARLHDFICCPHAPRADGGLDCVCRKPAAGMLLAAAGRHAIDLAASWMVGDILDDIEAGRRAGCRTILIDNGNETQWSGGLLRVPHHRVGDLAAAAQTIIERDAALAAQRAGVAA